VEEKIMAKSAIVKRSACIRGRKTSVSLEDAFWDYLKNVAVTRGTTPSALIAEIEAQDRDTNLSSAVRLFVLEHATRRLEQNQEDAGDMQPIADISNTQPIAPVLALRVIR
jgi:predicted DNA-binding ribbon-helix-helix protein